MIRKCLFIAVLLAMVFSLFACSGSSLEDKSPATPASESPVESVVGTPTPATLEKASADDIEWMSKVIASESGSVYDEGIWVRCTDEERAAVGWTVMNRLESGTFGVTVEEVVTAAGQYAYGQDPIPEIRELAKRLLEGQIPDLTDGATHFFSPISMPKEGEPTTGFDVGGGLHEVLGIHKKVYFPSWTETLVCVGEMDNVRAKYFMFYRSSTVPTQTLKPTMASKLPDWITAISISPESETQQGVFEHYPQLVVDGNGILHAIWVRELEEAVRENGKSGEDLTLIKESRVFMYSRKNNGTWLAPVHIMGYGTEDKSVKDNLGDWYTISEDIVSVKLVVDKFNTLHLTWIIDEHEIGPWKSGLGVLATEPIQKKLFYSQKPMDREWSEPVLLGRSKFGERWTQHTEYAKTTAGIYSTELFEKEFSSVEIDQTVIQVDSEGTLYLLVCLDTACGPWEDAGIYLLTRDQTGVWSSEPFNSPIRQHTVQPWFWLGIDDKDTWHLIWQNYLGHTGPLTYAERPKGADWQKPIEMLKVGETSPPLKVSAVVDSKGNLRLAWKQDSLFFYALKATGEPLGEPIRLTDHPDKPAASGATVLTILVDNNDNPHIVFGAISSQQVLSQDMRDDYPDDWALMYTTKTKDDIWSEPAVLFERSGDWYMVAHDEAIHAVFSVTSLGYRNIFYTFREVGNHNSE